MAKKNNGAVHTPSVPVCQITGIAHSEVSPVYQAGDLSLNGQLASCNRSCKLRPCRNTAAASTPQNNESAVSCANAGY